jgi:hypothetical protein
MKVTHKLRSTDRRLVLIVEPTIFQGKAFQTMNFEKQNPLQIVFARSLLTILLFCYLKTTKNPCNNE